MVTCQPPGDSMGAEAVWPALEGPWARRRVDPGPTLFRWVHQAPYIGNARKGVFVKSKLRPKNFAGFLRSALYLPRGVNVFTNTIPRLASGAGVALQTASRRLF